MVENKSKIIFESLKGLQWRKLFHMFYMEPIIMVLIFSNALSATIMRNQVIFQACTTLFNYNDSICEKLGTNDTSEFVHKIETEIQPAVSNLFMARTLLESIVPAICGIFIGSWADYYGRKPLLLISMIGFSLSYILSALICQLSFYIPVNPWYYIISAVPHSILGGNCVFSVAAYCFLSDVTDMKTRPYRMIFMDALFFVAVTLGNLLSSFIYNATNSTTVFSISGILLCSATVFTAMYVPETLHLKRYEEGGDLKKEAMAENLKDINLKNLNENDGNEKTIEKADEKVKDIGLFSMVHIRDMFRTCFKARECYDRSIIWLITGTLFLSFFIFEGSMGVVYLYVREKFHWTVRDFTFYETVNHSVAMLGALLGFLIMRKCFGVSVVSLALLSLFSDVVSSIVRGLAVESWHFYLAAGLGAFRTVNGPMCRTIVSNIVSQTDLGKIFSIKNILQSFAPFLASPLYTLVYNKSITTFPGLFFIVSSFLYGIAFIFMFFVLVFKYKCRDHYAKILK